MLPNFFVIGAAKSATTSLCAYLARHPEIFFCPYKEPSFFNRDDLYLDKGMAFYESMFDGAGEEKAVGEGSIQYSRAALFPQVAQRIAQHIPQGKIIYMVRHPVDRIESHYSQRLNNGHTILPFLNDIQQSPEHYIDTSDYWKQINIYRQYYPDDRILIIFFDEFRDDPDAILKKCFEFLEVNPDVRIGRTESVKNPRTLHQQDTKLLSILKKLPIFHNVRLLTPKSFRNLMRRKLRMPVQQVAQWDEPTLEWVIEELRENTGKFLKFYGKQEDFWNFDVSRAMIPNE